MPDPGEVTSIRVAAEPGVSQAELVSASTRCCPTASRPSPSPAPATEQNDLIEGDFLGFLRSFLLVFAGVALVVATFGIYNTFSILVAQRTRESALLQALGASRGQVLRSVAVEALLVGVIASAVGAVGLGLATGLLALMRATGLGLPASSLVLATGTVVTGMVVGVVVTLVASLAPALRASRIAPLATRDVAVDRSAASWLRARAGLVTTGTGVALVVLGTQVTASCRSPAGACSRWSAS